MNKQIPLLLIALTIHFVEHRAAVATVLCSQVDATCSGKPASFLISPTIERLASASAAVYLPEDPPAGLAAAAIGAVDNWNTATGTALSVIGAATGVIAIEWVNYGWVADGHDPGAYAEMVQDGSVRYIYLNLDTKAWENCPTTNYRGDYETILTHELGHALGLDHYVQDYDEIFGCGLEDGPESCTVMTHCYQGGSCEHDPGPLDKLAISCLYGIVPGGAVDWSFIKGLYGDCLRFQDSDVLALSSSGNAVVWNSGSNPSSNVMVFRAEAGQPLVQIGSVSPEDTIFVDNAAASGKEYTYLVATTNGDTLLDMGTAHAGLKKIYENGAIGQQLYNLSIHGESLFAVEGQFVRKFDISDPAEPIEVDEVNPTWVADFDALSISDNGQTVFATAGDRVLKFAASSLTTLAGFDLDAQSAVPLNDMVAQGDFAMVAGEGGLHAIGPVPWTQLWGICGAYATDYPVAAVDRVGDYLYLRRWTGVAWRSEIVRVTPNANGTCSLDLACASDMGCWTPGVVLKPEYDGSPSNGFALAAKADGTLIVLDVTDPVHPTILREIDVYFSPNVPYPLKGYAFDDRYLYLLTNMSGYWLDRGLHAYDLKTPGTAPIYATGGSGGVCIPHGFAAHGRYIYLSDTFDSDPWTTGNYQRFSTFQKAYMSADIGTAVRRVGGGELLADISATMCPQGDGDQIIIDVTMDASFVTSPPTANALTVVSPGAGTLAFGPAVTYADSVPSLSGGAYQTTVTLSSGRGCGEDSVGVYWDGTLLGYGKVRVTSPDADMDGAVGAIDFGAYVSHHPSSLCDCVEAQPYNGCFDFAPADTIIDVWDFSKYAGHHGHSTAGGSAPSFANSLPSEGRVTLAFSESVPAVGPRVLRVDIRLDDVEPFRVMFAKLKNGSGTYAFVGWHPATSDQYRSFGAEIHEDGSGDLVVGVASKKSASATSVDLGYFEFVASGTQSAEFDPDDFELLVADLLDLQSVERSVSGANFVRTTAPIQYRDELAQNYPNPFNPSTTIAFSLSRAAKVEIRIYDVRGARVRTLLSSQKDSGVHRQTWDGSDDNGTQVASGVYFYKLATPHFESTRKMVLLR